MRGYIDSTAGEIVAGDSLLDPMTGVLCRVTSVEPVNEKGIVAVHMIGSVSGSYMGLIVKPDRPVRRAPRNGEGATVDGVPGMYVVNPKPLTVARSGFHGNGAGLCLCGKRLQRECADDCVNV